MSGKATYLLTLLVTAGLFGVSADTTLARKANFDSSHSVFTKAQGETRPPIGYVNFCARYPSECRAMAIRGTTKVHLTPARWDLLMQVNSFVNRKIAPVTDQELYNRPEVWEYPTSAGDCEDYVLLKKRYLEGLGFPPETLLITVVLDEEGAGHAVLMIRTDSGDFILDNRRDRVLPWYRTGYRYLKRQSQQDPNRWVSLTHGRSRAKIFGRN